MLSETLLKIKQSYFSRNGVTLDKALEQAYQAGAEAEREGILNSIENWRYEDDSAASAHEGIIEHIEKGKQNDSYLANLGAAMTYIPYSEGKVYDKVHLRPFDLGLAKAGHPLAWRSGEEISHLLGYDQHGNIQIRVWISKRKKWEVTDTHEFMDGERLRLAPLAVKDGLPLHVGDVIEFNHPFGDGRFHKDTLKAPSDAFSLITKAPAADEFWRFPKDENNMIVTWYLHSDGTWQTWEQL